MAKTKNIRKIKRKTRSIKGGMWPFSKNEPQPQPQPQYIPSSNVFSDTRLSTEPNQDMNYEEAGIIHATEAVGINIGRVFITDIANAFGSKGLDLSRYDVCRTAVLTKLLNNVPAGCKVCNIKMDIENSAQNTSIHVHAYGTLMRLKMVRPISPQPIVPRNIELSVDRNSPEPKNLNPNQMPNQIN
jgi:hypothetical protein